MENMTGGGFGVPIDEIAGGFKSVDKPRFGGKSKNVLSIDPGNRADLEVVGWDRVEIPIGDQ